LHVRGIPADQTGELIELAWQRLPGLVEGFKKDVISREGKPTLGRLDIEQRL